MTNENGAVPTGLALLEVAEAEAAEAEARADAATARARAVRLRHELGQTLDSAPQECSADDDPSGQTEFAELDERPAREVAQRSRIRRPKARTVAFVAAAVALIALVTVNGLLAWHHHGVNRDRERAAQFAAAATKGVTNMTTLDFNKADADVARVLDNSTGEFRTDFASRVADFTKVLRDSKVVTVGTVKAAAVDSMTKNSAVVLVAASSTLADAAGAKEEPRKWRLSVTVSADGDQLKMSKVEFVP